MKSTLYGLTLEQRQYCRKFVGAHHNCPVRLQFASSKIPRLVGNKIIVGIYWMEYFRYTDGSSPINGMQGLS